MIPDLWRVGPLGIMSGPHLVRRCGPEEAARVVKAHNFYVNEPRHAIEVTGGEITYGWRCTCGARNIGVRFTSAGAALREARIHAPVDTDLDDPSDDVVERGIVADDVARRESGES